MTAFWQRVLDRLARQLRAEERPAPRPGARPAFTCPRCHRTSHHPMDLRYGWCSNCSDYTAPPAEPWPLPPHRTANDDERPTP